MLERVYGDVRIEELDRAFYTASVDLRNSSLVIERDGPLYLAVGSSMALPLVAPPQLRDERVLIDGSLLDNLPLAPMTFTGEGPVLAVDIKGGEERPRQDTANLGGRAQETVAKRARAPAVAVGNDIPHRPALELQYHRGRAPARRLHDRACGCPAWPCSSFTRSTRLAPRAAEPPLRRSRTHRPGCCRTTFPSPTCPAGAPS